jgi:hypothetical protein
MLLIVAALREELGDRSSELGADGEFVAEDPRSAGRSVKRESAAAEGKAESRKQKAERRTANLR